jgi:hypothetical protein
MSGSDFGSAGGAESALASTLCPVPPEQRPLQEYQQLLRSWFFIWPSTTAAALLRPLAISWLLALLPCLLVAGGSYSLRHDPPLLVLNAMLAALLLPLLLLLRQWLGWTYVRRRLQSERVEYEESGWYDGQVWEKPLAWRQRDLLVVRHQVAPVLQRLRRAVLLIIAVLLLAGGACQLL